MSDLRKGQVRLGPRTWAVIREAYLGGASGASLAEAYGCSLGTIRYRAVREGWRRCDVAEAMAPSAAGAAVGSQAGPPSVKQLVDLAMAAAMRALIGGRPSEASAYVRAAEAVQRLAGVPASGEEVYSPEELEARQAELTARADRIVALLAAGHCRQPGDPASENPP